MKFRETDLEVCSGKKFRDMKMHITSVNGVDKHPILNTGQRMTLEVIKGNMASLPQWKLGSSRENGRQCWTCLCFSNHGRKAQ